MPEMVIDHIRKFVPGYHNAIVHAIQAFEYLAAACTDVIDGKSMTYEQIFYTFRIFLSGKCYDNITHSHASNLWFLLHLPCPRANVSQQSVFWSSASCQQLYR